MNLDEAIENLKEEAEFEQNQGNLAMVVSLNLGIEAVKRTQKMRQAGIASYEALLPGETEE